MLLKAKPIAGIFGKSVGLVLVGPITIDINSKVISYKEESLFFKGREHNIISFDCRYNQ